MNILIAEDEDDIRNLIKLHLTKKGFNVYDACNGQDAYNIFNTIKLDLAILDVMMPLMDGVTLLKNIRKSSRIPVIFLTARSDDSDKILGLKLGADDYMIKPFNPAELTARVYAQLRRYYQYNSVEDESTYTIGDITVDSNSCTVTKNGNKIDLNTKEFKLLELLIKNVGKVYTKKQLYENVWQDIYCGDDNTIMVHISHLRDKIEDNPKYPKYLKTIRGIGYKLEEY
ncbi:MAG: response regulator transcription factor [Inconstantimicrobium porci]|uniref:response regulator transcription factor n=1 Tax=Inconstantimicrobium porci TaxID=2652291 RepID=UPI0024097A76|nr:response regulator transcription factor [Inconstantimicrobium porci]MDD6769896.1 response regulator transcription factor [Inconstantimicrobium porci]MDY5912797.1 response regulator transcription factor [Inconstantimicrobium porci]